MISCLLFRSGHVAFDAFTRAYDHMKNESSSSLDRRLFERLFIIYAMAEYQLFMGEGSIFMDQPTAFLPRHVFTDFDNFILDQYDLFYKQFVSFWGTHKSFHPCQMKTGDQNHCSSTIICDGHMKIRRRLCSNPNVSHKVPPSCSPVFNRFFTGCPRTPALKSMMCSECKGYDVPMSTYNDSSSRKKRKTTKGRDNLNQSIDNEMAEVS